MDRGRLVDRLSGLPGLRVAYLFGSLARGTEHAGSDVDVAILVDPPLGARDFGILQEALSEAAGREVDLVDLGGAPPLLRFQVISTGERLVVVDDRGRTEFEVRTMRDYMDTRHLRSIQHHYLRERAGARRVG
jgi:predicted nucleotidyltransferase